VYGLALTTLLKKTRLFGQMVLQTLIRSLLMVSLITGGIMSTVLAYQRLVEVIVTPVVVSHLRSFVRRIMSLFKHKINVHIKCCIPVERSSLEITYF
jgi:hypothetical protein